MYPSCLQTDTSTLVVERELILRSSADAGGGDLIIAGRASADNGGAERKCGVHVTQAVDARREGVVGAEARCLRGGRGGGSRGLTQRMPAEVRPTPLSSETWGGGGLVAYSYTFTRITLRSRCANSMQPCGATKRRLLLSRDHSLAATRCHKTADVSFDRGRCMQT